MDNQNYFPAGHFFYQQNQQNQQNPAPVHGMYHNQYNPQYAAAQFQYQRNTHSPASSTTSQESQQVEAAPPVASGKQRREYDTWTQQQQKLLVQLWAENHEWLESKDARKTWRKICDEVNGRIAGTSKTVEKCTKKMKYLVDRYKTVKEWNRKQSGGSIKKSMFYDEIDEVLGCRDIVTLSHVSEAGSSASSSATLNTSTSSAASTDTEVSNRSPASTAENLRKERKKTRKRPREATVH